jgi:hypothetical protein
LTTCHFLVTEGSVQSIRAINGNWIPDADNKTMKPTSLDRDVEIHSDVYDGPNIFSSPDLSNFLSTFDLYQTYFALDRPGNVFDTFSMTVGKTLLRPMKK